MNTAPDLSSADLDSAAMKKLRDFYEQRLARLRAQNDGDLPPEKTLRLRGRIQEIKAFLSIGKELPKHDPDPWVL